LLFCPAGSVFIFPLAKAGARWRPPPRKNRRSKKDMLRVDYTHEGLKQSSTMRTGEMVRTVHMVLPLFLTLPVWQRHDYSLDDVQVTLDCFSAENLWQCALLLGVTTSNSAVKLSFTTPESLVFSSKAIVIRKLIKLLHDNQFFTSQVSVLDKVRDEHEPPLPIHRLCRSDFELLCSLMPTQPVALLRAIPVVRTFRFKNTDIVPLWVEGGALYCVRVVPADVYQSARKPCRSLSTRPLDIRIGDLEYAGLEEAMFFEPSDE
jgi:hypothetical protein